ncbi:MAG: electron transfer flavoprotein subunit alpha/FixB family protein [Dehalococcoidia bacterium]|nr:electron transfer flavoprotein subunit alpha/FixB family protein [Dehalococcoidia bacterium]
MDTRGPDNEKPSESKLDNRIWFFVEHKEGRLDESSHLLAGESRIVADRLERQACAVILGHRIAEFATAFRPQGLDEALVVDDQLLDTYSSTLFVTALAQLVEQCRPSIILFGSTPMGNDLAPRLAARLKVGFVSRYTEIELERDGRLVIHRPIHGGKARATVTPLVMPVVATIDPQTLGQHRVRAPKDPVVIEPRVRLDARVDRTRAIDYLKADPCAVCVSEAEIVIGVGKGLQCAENLVPVEELARLLGASIGGSRRATDEHWVSDERRIGMTGKIITPRLYLTCGISGAFHHTLSIKGSKLMVSINTDRNAPITKMADLAVIGDMHEIIPELTKQLRELGDSAS